MQPDTWLYHRWLNLKVERHQKINSALFCKRGSTKRSHPGGHKRRPSGLLEDFKNL